MKICCRCKEEKHLEEFHNSKSSSDGKTRTCKECDNRRKRESWAKNNPKFVERQIVISLTPDGSKYCSGCETYKLVDAFYKKESSLDGLRSRCIECHAKDGASRHRDKYKGSDELRNRMRKNIISKYNITLEQYEQILDRQNYSCGSCKRHISDLKLSLAVDHDHNCCSGRFSCGNCIRGLLCNSCNTGIGSLGDNIEGVQNALDYLNQSYVI